MKVLIIGVAAAAALGVAAGDSMRPVLAVAPPPMEGSPWGEAALGASEPAGVWTGPGPVPDYVIGTDWAPREIAPLPFKDLSWAEAVRDEPLPEPDYFRAAYDQEAPAPAAYPSESGDILAGVERRSSADEAPPEPPPA